MEDDDDAYLDDWIWLGAEEDVGFNAYMSLGNELALCNVPSIDKLCDDREEGGGGEEEDDEHELEPGTSFAKKHAEVS
jgi:hypothetical protein